ncbi:dipeptidylpeptidase [Coemansia sp. RSA 2559]|nr:dipeptidylpeptidase [Coemansia sp. RSA 2559]KAJ2863310.1 dipeptidylpeptidase [Coemansia erecta]
MRIAIAGTCYCALGWLAAAGAAQSGSGAYEKNTKPLDIRGPAIVSPDATRLLLTQSRYDQDEKAMATYISVVDVASGATRRLTPDAAGKAYANPLWFDSKTIGYMHDGALYRQPAAGGSNGTALYRPAVAYRPGCLTFVAAVYPNTTSLEESRRQGEAEKTKADSAQLFDNLWVRHWDEWMTPKKPNPAFYTQWNPNVYASAGFVVVQINFHGSGSYGQNFTDSIACQWGGYPYEDLMKGLDHVLAAYAFVDPTRIVALGASYGGYMMNWFNANSNRFRALVSHDGLFSTPAFWYSTEELWFPEHDFGGVPYNSAARRTYEAFNPERLAANFSTPTLFVHGARDFRLSLEQSLAPFTLLRRKGVQARLMFFADENHWTTRTANSVKWYTEVLRWIATHTNTTLPYDL